MIKLLSVECYIIFWDLFIDMQHCATIFIHLPAAKSYAFPAILGILGGILLIWKLYFTVNVVSRLISVGREKKTTCLGWAGPVARELHRFRIRNNSDECLVVFLIIFKKKKMYMLTWLKLQFDNWMINLSVNTTLDITAQCNRAHIQAEIELFTQKDVKNTLFLQITYSECGCFFVCFFSNLKWHIIHPNECNKLWAETGTCL